MDRKFWGSAVLVIGLLVAAWIYLDLQKHAWERTDSQVTSVIEQVDSMTGKTPSSGEKRGMSLTQRLHGISEMQQRPTDSLKRIIEQDNLLGSEPSSK